jgi:anti-sigma-K factor RskA
MSDIEIHHLGAAYALDALDEHERIAFEAHYGSCEICRTDVREFRETAAELGRLTESGPPADLRARVMSDITTTRQLSPLPPVVVNLADRRRAHPVRVALSIAAAAVMFVAGALVFGARGTDGFDDQVAQILTSPNGRVTQLVGAGDGSFTVAWSGNRAAVIGHGLAYPGAGFAYELWLIDADGANALRLLDGAPDGDIERIIEIDGTPAAWGVTIEPKGGSLTPTEPVLFVADV